MKLIIGIGNPGKQYELTRHNVGFICLDAFASKHQLEFKIDTKMKGEYVLFNHLGEKVVLLKPLTYVNLSGESVILLMNYFKIPLENILVVYDDLDLEVGHLKIKESGSAAGHNGIKNMISHLNTQNFKRIKVGISRNKNIDMSSHVLGKFTKDELITIQQAVDKTILAIEDFISNKSFLNIMTDFNTKNPRPQE